MDKEQNNRELTTLVIGEVIVSALTVLGAFVISLFTDFTLDYTVFTGVLLGSAVVVLNFLFLSLSVNRAVDSYLEARGSREMTDEEAEKFTAENSMAIQNKIKTSFIIRTVTMLAALVTAFLLEWFNPLCTAIPLLAFNPILSIGEMIRRRGEPAPAPENFIKYEENTEEKESDE
ncbi:MAG: hypothetical protein IJX92_04120 [Clostridia bacterium]|nr:hypothetical protein [Clostridia bacterium]